MSKSDLVRAYLQGRITRRDFIFRLRDLGITAAAAAAYAKLLSESNGDSNLTRNDEGYLVAAEVQDNGFGRGGRHGVYGGPPGLYGKPPKSPR